MKTSQILNLTEEEKENLNYKFIGACILGDSEKVKEIMKGYYDPNISNGGPIGFASENNYLEIVKLLLEHGADPSIDDNFAIEHAYIRGHKEIVKLLIKYERVRNSLSEERIKKYENI